MLSKYDNTKQKRIWYYTDDVSKFSDDIANKEHQIEGLGNVNENWLQEVRINNKGDIVPSKVANNFTYKNCYCWNGKDTNAHVALVGCRVINSYTCGIFTIDSIDGIFTDAKGLDAGFAKVTILDT